MRTRLDMDAPYLVHPHARAIHHQPFPAEALRALHIIRTLMVHTTDFAEVEWLEAREAMLIESCADCPPARVRNVEAPRRDRPPRHEQRYGRRGYGPTNASGRAKS
jgi:hypothetical protein